MLLVTTPTGNTGSAVLKSVLAAGERPRVLLRDPAKLGPETLGQVEVVQGDLHDPDDLARALEGIEGAFFCVPQSPDPDDLSAYYRSFTEPLHPGRRGRRAWGGWSPCPAATISRATVAPASSCVKPKEC